MAALYLRGLTRPFEPARRGWPAVLNALRAHGAGVSNASSALRASGLWSEAACLESGSTLAEALDAVNSRRVLTPCEEGYPSRWLSVLGPAAPPALWRTGEAVGGQSISIVGSRQISPPVRALTFAVGLEAAHLGLIVVSGGAAGCDRAGIKGALSAASNSCGVLEILPCGLTGKHPEDGICRVSVCAPGEPFSTAAAMERNALIYAASSHTFVGQARFKQGGTWTGATEALRRKLSTLLVPERDDLALKALRSLGAIPLSSPSHLAEAMQAGAVQGKLFISAG